MRAAGPDPRIARWLEAEAREDEREAESALQDLFGTLPRPGLSPAFADRVLARVAAEPAPWPLEQAAACLLLLCGMALAATRLWLPVLWDHLSPETWFSAGAGLVVRLAQAIAALAPVWEAAGKVAGWAALAGSSPQVLALLATCGLLSTVAGHLLLTVLGERSSGHAQA
jgi:hypothetical protein